MSDTIEAVRTGAVVEPPRPWMVIIHNDPVTPMHFVVDLIMAVFHKPLDLAFDLMTEVHEKDRAVIGPYSADVAQTKAQAAMQFVRSAGHPLYCEAVRDTN